MRKLLVVTVLLLLFSVAYIQTPQRGSSFCLHVFTTLELKPSVTMEQHKDFLRNVYYPEFEKRFADVKLFFIEGEWGLEEDNFGMIYYSEDVETRDKYYKKGGGGFTEEGIETFKKVKLVFEKLMEQVEDYDREYTCWTIL